MATFEYKAATSSGEVVKNRVEASSRLNLVERLKANNLMPITVTQVSRDFKRKKAKKNLKDISGVSLKNMVTTQISATPKTQKNARNAVIYSNKVESRDLSVFTQNFYLLKKANFNNIHALRTIIASTENPTLASALEDILVGVEAGEYMYTTMEYYSDIFPYIYTNMIKVGELSGSLDNSLEQAVKYLDSTNEISLKLKKILVPNIITFVALIVMLFVGTIVAIPAIQNVYDSFESTAKLPKITIWYQGVVNWQIHYWYTIVIAIAAIAGAIFLYVQTPTGKYRYDYFKYKGPVFGKLVFSLDFSRFLKAMLLNLRNGMRIQEAMDVSKNVVNNYVMLSLIETAMNNILVGDSWIEPFEASGLASPMITEMLKIGMETDLTEMMEKLVEYMEIDIDIIIEKITRILPQIVYAIVGAILIFFVLVVLVPCIQVYMGNFLFEAAGV